MTAIDTQVKEVEKMFAVNVFGPMRMVHFFHGQLVLAQGKIVNIGSVGGIVPYVYGCKYYNPILSYICQTRYKEISSVHS